MPKVLITGSLAYDYIMRFNDVFANHILPDKLEILNVSFTADEMDKKFGGTAGNIAYTLKMLDGQPVIFATAGNDFGEYEKWFSENNIDTSDIVVIKDVWTASAHIITDKKDNQLTAFYGGAMLKNEITLLPVLEKHSIAYAIIAADGKQGMLTHARELKEKKVPFIYDPGHSIPSCNKEELLELADGSEIVIVNDYEEELFCDKAQITREQLLKMTKYLIVTLKDKGSIIYSGDQKIEVAVTPTEKAVDPTGAGDAYRGGLLKGLLHNLPIEQACQIASVAACYNVEHAGTQGHRYTLSEFYQRYTNAYGEQQDVKNLFISS